MKLLNPLILVFFFSSCQSGFHQKRNFPPENKMRLCFIGDTGTNSEMQARAAKALSEENCNTIYVLGDIIYPTGLIDADDPQAEEKFFKHYRPIHEKNTSVLFHIILGNHDYRGNPSAWIDIAKTNPMIYAPARYYFEEYSGVCVAALDTNLPKLFVDFPKNLGQKSWHNDFKDRLKDHCHLKIALGHHPYLGTTKKHGNAKGTLKSFLEDHVIGTYDYYLAGHDHLLDYKGIEKGTELYISGAGGNVKDNPGYITMDITKDEKGFHVKTLMREVHADKTVTLKGSEKLFGTTLKNVVP